MSTTVEVARRFTVTTTSPDSDALDAHLDQVMEELIDLDCGDPSITLDRSANSVELSLMFTIDQAGVTELDAMGAQMVELYAMTQFRVAIHAAGGGTAGWPEAIPPAPEPDEPTFTAKPAGDVELAYC